MVKFETKNYDKGAPQQGQMQKDKEVFMKIIRKMNFDQL